MKSLNTNDFIILSSIRDSKNNLGMCKARGSTVKMIIEKSNLSDSTVRRSLKKLLARNFIDYAIKQVNKDSFYVTELGIREISEVKKIIKLDMEE